MLMKKTVLAAAGASLLAAAACSPRTNINAVPGLANRSPVTTFNRANAGTGKKWTVLMLLAGDNNLYSAALDDINEMEAGLAKNPQAAEMIDFIVLFDGLPKGDSKIYRILPDKNGYDNKIISEVIDDKGLVIPPSKEVDSGSAETLNKFIDFGTKNFNSQYNGVVVWNHGSGIDAGRRGTDNSSFFDVTGLMNTESSAPSKSFASDDQSGNHMQLSDLNPALAIANKNLGKRVDFLDFDTCLMQYVETAYQIKGQVNILVASEELEPGDGQDYEGYLGALAQNPNMNPVQLTTAIVDTFGASYRPGGSQRGRDVTLSAIDVDKMVNNFVPALNAFAGELKANLGSNKAAISDARNRTQTFYNRDSVDLGDFLKKLNVPISTAAPLKQAMDSMTIRETHYGPGVEGATGVQIYMPRSTMSYGSNYSNPAKIRFAETGGWADFLQAFTSK
jgi:hypothetical protein